MFCGNKMEVSIRNRLKKQDLILPDEEVSNHQNNNFSTIDYSEVKELILDGSKLREISLEDCEFLGRFNNLQHLSLNATGLQKLNNLPKLENLKVLELQDNYISCGLDILQSYKNLRCLLLGGNKIRDFSELLPLKELPNLEILSLLLNPITEINNDSYRSTVFETLPNLVILDEMNREGKEVEDYGYDEDDVEVIDDDTEGGEDYGADVNSRTPEDNYDDEDDDDEDDDDDIDNVDLKEFYENDLSQDDDDDEGDFEPGDLELNEIDNLDDDEDDDDEDDDDEDEDSQVHSKKQRLEVEVNDEDECDEDGDDNN